VNEEWDFLFGTASEYSFFISVVVHIAADVSSLFSPVLTSMLIEELSVVTSTKLVLDQLDGHPRETFRHHGRSDVVSALLLSSLRSRSLTTN
jgi:hypothetical protein